MIGLGKSCPLSHASNRPSLFFPPLINDPVASLSLETLKWPSASRLYMSNPESRQKVTPVLAAPSYDGRLGASSG